MKGANRMKVSKEELLHIANLADLKIKDDENFKERGTRGRRYLRNSSGRRGVIPGKTGNKVLLNSFQTRFKNLPEGL